ncbi:MAG: hypothetical protein IJJ28_02345 [Lentisphaeria bacterium]|nr:hypothetical protein [Lentisphaeria bacterium]
MIGDKIFVVIDRNRQIVIKNKKAFGHSPAKIAFGGGGSDDDYIIIPDRYRGGIALPRQRKLS